MSSNKSSYNNEKYVSIHLYLTEVNFRNYTDMFRNTL